MIVTGCICDLPEGTLSFIDESDLDDTEPEDLNGTDDWEWEP